jgi:hypothetical protein
MTKSVLFAGACVFVMATTASAEPWVDWSPQKGVWNVTAVKVDANHIDDYLVGLKKAWVPGEEYAKKQGLIDQYEVLVNVNSAGASANVLLIEHAVSFASMDPNKKRDQDAMKAMDALMAKNQRDSMVSGFDKYRTFVGQEMWQAVEFSK